MYVVHNPLTCEQCWVFKILIAGVPSIFKFYAVTKDGADVGLMVKNVTEYMVAFW